MPSARPAGPGRRDSGRTAVDASVMPSALPAGSIDVPAAGSLVHRGPLIVGGWALGTSGPVTEVLVVVDGRAATGASIGAERADVADLHPRVPNAERSGWEARIDLRGV